MGRESRVKEGRRGGSTKVKEPPAKKYKKATMASDGNNNNNYYNNNNNNNNNNEKDKRMSVSMQRKQQIMERRKRRNPNFDLETKLKQTLEEYRQLNRELQRYKRVNSTTESDPELQENMDKKLNDIAKGIRGKGLQFSLKGDMSRVVQALLKHGTEEHRRALYEKEFKGHLVEMSSDKYAHHIVETLFTYVCTPSSGLHDVRVKMFGELEGTIMNQLTKQFSAATVDHIYSRIANKEERFSMTREFYGTSHISLLRPDDQLEDRCIVDILREQPGKRLVVAKRLGRLVKKCIEKGLFDYLIIHQLLADVFEIGEKSDVTDVVYDLAEMKAIPYILHTINGCKASIYSVSYASPAVRQILVDSLVGHTAKIAKDPYGAIVLCRIFDVIDDVDQSGKLMSELKEDMLGTITDENACKIILHLLSPYNKSYFKNALDLELLVPTLRRQIITTHEQLEEAKKKELERKKVAFGEDYIKSLEQQEQAESSSDATEEDVEEHNNKQDEYLSLICKKPLSQKHQELFNVIASDLLNMIIKRTSELLSDARASNVIFEILRATNLKIVCGDDDELRSNRKKVVLSVIDAFMDDTNQYRASRTISRLILCEKSDMEEKHKKNEMTDDDTDGGDISEDDLFVPQVFHRFDGQFAQKIEAHPTLAFLFSALLKSGYETMVDKAVKELAPSVSKLKTMLEETKHHQTQKGLGLLVKIIEDKLRQE